MVNGDLALKVQGDGCDRRSSPAGNKFTRAGASASCGVEVVVRSVQNAVCEADRVCASPTRRAATASITTSARRRAARRTAAGVIAPLASALTALALWLGSLIANDPNRRELRRSPITSEQPPLERLPGPLPWNIRSDLNLLADIALRICPFNTPRRV